MGIPASRRLRSNSDFQKVRRAGHRIHCGPFILNAQRDEASVSPSSLGVVASRRVGNAIKRNRGKRLVREIFRIHGDRVPNGVNLVAVLRAGYDRHSFVELESRFLQGIEKLKLGSESCGAGTEVDSDS